MQQDSARLEAFLKDRNLTEHEVAVMAGVSQSTVSRARHVSAQRSGRARKRLFIFLENELSGNVTAGSGRDQVLNAFDGIWDGSEIHATAVAKVIHALDGLRPLKKQKE